MKEIISKLIKREFDDAINSIKEIHHGSVNKVFDVTGKKENYIVRLNDEKEKKVEFKKEEFCLAKVRELGVPSPKVLAIGTEGKYEYLIQNKVKGINGSLSSKEDKLRIWQRLGQYASKYNQITQILVEQNNFHNSWASKLSYNIDQLSSTDALLVEEIFSPIEHTQIKKFLLSLKQKKFTFGLVHGDLSPRNVIIDEENICLLDWGTAEINVIPHTEIGIVLIEKEASQEEFTFFLKGLGIPKKKFKEIERELRMLNLLLRLDIYRWALGRSITHKNNYIGKLQEAYIEVTELD